MSFNFAELQQKANRVIHNSDEFVRKWVEFISAPAGNINLEYYDQNGNLRTVSFPNRNKLVQDFIANTSRVMFKTVTVYVDQANGDDRNDGSKSAPFKTLKKAVDSVPSGGRVIINVLGNYTIREHIHVENKKVIIRMQDRKILKTTWYQDSGNNNNSLYGFRCSGFVGLEFHLRGGSKIILDDEGFSTTVKGGTSSYKQFIQKTESCVGYVYVRGFYGPRRAEIELAGVNSFPVFMSTGHLHSSEALILHMSLVNIRKSRRGYLTYGDGIFGLKAWNTKVVGSNNRQIRWDIVISGIIRDSRGTPRNVISNIIL